MFKLNEVKTRIYISHVSNSCDTSLLCYGSTLGNKNSNNIPQQKVKISENIQSKCLSEGFWTAS